MEDFNDMIEESRQASEALESGEVPKRYAENRCGPARHSSRGLSGPAEPDRLGLTMIMREQKMWKKDAKKRNMWTEEGSCKNEDGS